MKSKMLLSITFALMTLIYCAEDLNTFDKVGFASNDQKSEAVTATSYAIAKTNTDQYFINNQKGFSTPEYVATLPPRKPITGGKIVSVDEVSLYLNKLPSESDYYDGSRKLKITSTTCNQWTTLPQLCMKQSSCGWCGSTNTCIPGNNLGPLAPCLAGKFFFSAPDSNFNLLNHNNYSVSRKAVGGAQLTTLVDNSK